jgi:hypothetical protein
MKEQDGKLRKWPEGIQTSSGEEERESFWVEEQEQD